MSEWLEARYLNWSDLQNLCIKREWYTSGSNEDYEKLRASLCDGRRDLSTDAIIEIAKDIAAHSVGGWEVADIAFEVAGVCHYVFFLVSWGLSGYAMVRVCGLLWRVRYRRIRRRLRRERRARLLWSILETEVMRGYAAL